MTVPMAFLFLDECSYERLDLAALTGVLLPVESYTVVRDAMCKLVADVLRAPAHTFCAPLELHARDLLSQLKGRDQAELDADRLTVLRTVVGLVNQHDLHVLRVTYLNRKEIAKLMEFDPKLYGLTFPDIQSALQDIMRDTLILPVMDGVPGCEAQTNRAPAIDRQLIRAFALSVRWIHHARQYRIRDSISVANVINLAEPVFANSAYSTLLQLVDLVSHLLLQLERDELEPDIAVSSYRRRVLECARSLRVDLVHSWKGRMQIGPSAAMPNDDPA